MSTSGREKGNATRCIINVGVDAGNRNAHKLCGERERSDQDMVCSTIRGNKYGPIGDMRDRILATLHVPRRKIMSVCPNKIR